MSEHQQLATSPLAATAPALAGYTEKILFGDVWKRPGLSPRDYAGWPTANTAVPIAQRAFDEAKAAT